MADTEFEQFRQYFDELPQYIKAPAHCYTLVPNIDLDAESPTTTGQIPSIQVPASSNKIIASQTCTKNNVAQYDDSSSDEPFAGDLQIVPMESEESANTAARGSMNRISVPTRKRRKLPEVPKRLYKDGHNSKSKPSKHPNGEKQLSLAEELFYAEQSALSDSTTRMNLTGPDQAHNYPNCSQADIMESFPPSSTTTRRFYGSDDRPFFVLKFNNNGSSNDDQSSSDSERFPSFDSGHSTVHSDDGLKQFSSQILSPTHGSSSFSPSSPVTCQVPASHLDLLEATHRGLHKFVPRHHDEIEVDIGDPIYVQREADDLWCEGVNLRTGLQGIFPSAYVVDVEYNDFDPSANKVKKERYVVNFLGSIETLYHKGNEVLCQAVKKIASQDNYVATHARACILEISDQGIHMVDKGKLVPNHVPCHDYFYALKNVSFCGFHPNDHRYFCFVTKHPTLNRFACHVFMSQDSTRPVAEAVGRAFQRFYQKFLETAYPIEDIYLE